MNYVIYHKESTYYISGMKREGYGSKGAATRALNHLVDLSVKRHTAAVMMEGVSIKPWDAYKAEQARVAETVGLSVSTMINLQRPDQEHVLNKDDYAITDRVTFEMEIEKEVERINLMSGEAYKEAINTPGYLSPSRESYWSL